MYISRTPCTSNRSCDHGNTTHLDPSPPPRVFDLKLVNVTPRTDYKVPARTVTETRHLTQPLSSRPSVPLVNRLSPPYVCKFPSHSSTVEHPTGPRLLLGSSSTDPNPRTLTKSFGVTSQRKLQEVLRGTSVRVLSSDRTKLKVSHPKVHLGPTPRIAK